MTGGQRMVEVVADDWVAAHQQAKTDGFDFFEFLDVIDRPESQTFDVVTCLRSSTTTETRTMWTTARSDIPQIASLAEAFPVAAWHEWETTDLFGITFQGLRPNPGFLTGVAGAAPPLRKTTALTTRLDQPWPGSYEPGANDGTTRRRRPKPIPGNHPTWTTPEESTGSTDV